MLSQRDQINRVKLYVTALTFLGVDASPRDSAIDDLGCADSVSGVIYQCFGPILKWSVSTAELYNLLNTSPQFRKVTDFRPGDIIISPTGMGKSSAMPNGHVGIVGENEEVMSNSSATGIWTNNYTLTSWVEKYRKKGGYPIFVFRKI